MDDFVHANLPNPGKVAVPNPGRCGRGGNEAGPPGSIARREGRKIDLSVVPAPQSAIGTEAPGEPRPERCPDIVVVDAPLPAGLRQFGRAVRVSTVGNAANPPIVVLGGISADCFPAVRPDFSAGWWCGLAGEGRAINPERHYVIGMDFAADESGETAPSTHDQALVLSAALDAIGVAAPVTIVGASYGGMVALALAEADPKRVERLVIVCAAAEPHPAATAARELQRRVVSLGLAAGRGPEALALARGMAMLTYRTAREFGLRFEGGIGDCAPGTWSDPGSYLRARGEAFTRLMSPGRFLSLSASIDRHRVDPAKITAPCLLIGAASDQLVFPEQIETLGQRLSGAVEVRIQDSLFGHDMFLKEAAHVGSLIEPFIRPGA